MGFKAPSWVPPLPFDPPGSISIPDFLFEEEYGRCPYDKSLPSFTCGLSGKEYSANELRGRVENLAKGLSKELGWLPHTGTEWDKVVGVFSLNTIDVSTVAWATHRLSGIATPANADYSISEVVHQMKSSGAKCIFTCLPLLEKTIEIAKQVEIPRSRIYLLELPAGFVEDNKASKEFTSVNRLIEEGSQLVSLAKLRFKKGQGGRQTAYLCYSSGTSGLPKAVMISHKNIIANVLMASAYDQPGRERLHKESGYAKDFDVSLGLLPFNHIYALVLICHYGVYMGNRVVVLPRFEPRSYLQAIETYRIRSLYLVPPIIIMMIKNKSLCDKYDLSSVQSIITGAAPLGAETADELNRLWPHWYVRQGYGMTESATLVSWTSPDDIDFGSSGSLIAGVEARIISEEGNDITEYDVPGELLIKSPSVVLGYLNNEEATKETFRDGWLHTGDKALIRKSPRGNEHLWIVDRLKELIKVKGLQVAPAELEAHLLTHPSVSDVAVISVPDDRAGEVPKAYVVKAPGAIEDSDRLIMRDIKRHVEKHKSKHKWLQGGVEFIDAIPKSSSGKILRRLLRDREAEKRRKAGARL